MSSLKTSGQAPTPADELDASYDELSALVCELGPAILTRGMTPLEANRSILACIKRLQQTIEILEEGDNVP